MASVPCPTNGLPSRLYCRKGGATYYIEPVSDTIFQIEMPTVSDMGKYADEQYSEGAYAEYAKARDLKLATARRRLETIARLAGGKRLLDIGCGTGFFLEAAKEQGFDIRGVEFSSVAISLAHSDVRERIVRGDVNHLLSVHRDRFDVVTAFDILEHVQDPRQFLDEMYQTLDPGGLAAISTPDTRHFLRYLMRSKWPMLQPMQHTVLFSKRGIGELLRECGFEVVTIDSEHKVLTADYLAEQLVATNPMLHAAFNRTKWIIPQGLRRRPFAINIGELIAFARKPT